MRLFAPLALSAVVLPACGDDDTPGSSGSSGSSDGTGTDATGSTGSTSTATGTTDSSTATDGATTGGATGGTGPGTTGTDPTCMDSDQNGLESDVDCGGEECDACGDGLGCFIDSDCRSNVCDLGLCVAAACDDQTKNGGETDVDCGGLCPEKCINTQGCLVNADCVSDFCDPMDNLCKPAACVNTVMDEMETDVDCGGGECSPCPDGDMCLVSGDCLSGVCDPTGMTCLAPACDDGVLNGTETDVDCGGSCPSDCMNGDSCIEGDDCISGVCQGNACVPAECDDGVHNGGETDVDCGGACIGCDPGSTCTIPADCLEGVCDATSMTCSDPACDDNVTNQDETDLDCGGACGSTCQTGEQCLVGGDCVSVVCDTLAKVCVDANCSDQVQNSDETDTDCGGGCGATCNTGEMCIAGGDCISGVCDTTGTPDVCAAAACTDSVQNGDETDVDCGGSCVNKCDTGEKCEVDGDCVSLVCDPLTETCTAPACDDGVTNGTEEGPDCHGSCDPACTIGSEVTVNTTITGLQLRPKVAVAPDGSWFVVLWTSVGQDADASQGVYAQRYDGSGVAQGVEFQINTTFAGSQDWANVDASNTGFVVAWETPDADSTGIVAQRFDSAGAKVGAEIAVNTSTIGAQRRPDVTVDGSGDFVVCFHDQVSTSVVLCQRYNSSGVAQGSNDQANTDTSNNHWFAAVESDDGGAYTVVWQAGGDHDTDGDGISMQRFASDGTPDGGETQVNTVVIGNQRAPAIGMNASGQYIVVWNGPDTAFDDGTFAQRFTAAGAAQGSEMALNVFTAGAQINAKAAATASGNFLTVWESANQDPVFGVYGKRLLNDGTVVGDEYRLNTTTSSSQDTPDIGVIALDEFVAVWESPTSNSDIVMQRFNADFL